MRKWLVTAGWLLVFLLPVPVQAQDQVHFSSVKVDVWPEYDRAAVLVMYQISLAPATVLPATLTLHLPAKAEIWAVAGADSSGTLANASYDRQMQGDSATLSLTTNSLEVHVEYYDPLVRNGAARHVAYRWAGEYAVDALTTDFMQPAGATDLILAPASVSSTTDQGLTHYQTAPVSLAAGQIFSLTADYQKQNNAVSISTPPAAASMPEGPSVRKGLSLSGGLPWILGGLGLALVVSGLVVAWRFRRGTRPPSSGASTPDIPDWLADRPAEGVYCFHCGRKAEPGDVFCRACGTRLRQGG